MNYLDNPWRPRHRLWFGPGTMIQFMMDCGYLPGTTHDISMFPMKQGVGGALTDIQNNHPNDLVCHASVQPAGLSATTRRASAGSTCRNTA